MQLVHLLTKKIRLILVWAFLCALLVAIVTLLLPKQYNAQSQILVISRSSSGVDPYTQAKSAETIGENLSQVINTTDFYEKVIASSDTFNKDYWKKLADRKRRKEWQKDVQASVVYGTGLLNINTYASGKQDAINLSKAVSNAVATYGWEYVGGNVVLKVVTQPLEPKFPARPNFVLNTVAGFILGGLLAVAWLVRYKKHHLLV